MAEENEKVVFIATHGQEDPERATFPFLLATAAQAMDTEAVIFALGNAVHLATKGYADSISLPGFKPLKTLIEEYVNNGGKILL
jgi:predicted peroxiredoxin